MEHWRPEMLKVLVVDDSPFIRRVLTDWIASAEDLELVGVAKNGVEAVQLNRQLQPDVVTLDVEMPGMDGLTALQEMLKDRPVAVLMVSSLTQTGAEASLKALEWGALDCIGKPNGSHSLHFLQTRDTLLAKIRAMRHARVERRTLRPMRAQAPRMAGNQVVVVASSTGGPKALTTLFESLPENFPAPILIVQHMPAAFTSSLAARLDKVGTVPCREAVEGDHVTPGLALLAPGGKHLQIEAGGRIKLTEDPPMHGVRPAADVLFSSAAATYGRDVLGVVLTGMGKDGAAGALSIIQHHGTVLGEDESTCVIYGMPRAAKAIGGITTEYPIHALGKAICFQLERGRDSVAAVS